MVYTTTLEHESTHALQPTAERKLDYEVLAHSEEYKFAERVYGDENPWKDHVYYKAWKNGDVEEFKKTLWKGVYGNAGYTY